MDKKRVQGASIGRAGDLPRSPYPSRVRSVDPAIVYGRRLNLLLEICAVSLRRLRAPRGGLTAEQKSADGILGRAVGKASEALDFAFARSVLMSPPQETVGKLHLAPLLEAENGSPLRVHAVNRWRIMPSLPAASSACSIMSSDWLASA
jgi:hypothetical protein